MEFDIRKEDGTITITRIRNLVGALDSAIPDQIYGMPVRKAILNMDDYPYGFIRNLSIPASLHTIEGDFQISGRLYIAEDNPSFSTDGASLFSADGTSLLRFSSSWKTDYVIPKGVEQIAENAFSNSMIQHLRVPSTLKAIGAHAFHGCTALRTIEGNPVTLTIHPAAFEDIPWVDQKPCVFIGGTMVAWNGGIRMHIPEGVHDLSCAHRLCNVQEVWLPHSMKILPDSLFRALPMLKILHIPAETEEMEPLTPGTCEIISDRFDSIIVEASNRFLKASDHVLYTQDETQLLLYPPGKPGTEYIVPERVEVIHNRAFCRNPYLKTIAFPHFLKTIGDGACSNMTALQSVRFQSMDTGISNGCFLRCPALTDVQLPSSCFRIKACAFREDAALKHIILPQGLQEIGDCAFEDTGLSTVQLPESLIRLGSEAFRNTDVRELVLPKHLEETGDEPLSKKYSRITVYSTAKAENLGWLTSTILTIKDARDESVICKVLLPDPRESSSIREAYMNAWKGFGIMDFKKTDSIADHLEFNNADLYTAVFRLTWPIDLSKRQAAHYRAMIRQDSSLIADYLIRDHFNKELETILSLHLVKKKDLDTLLRYAQKNGDPEVCAIILKNTEQGTAISDMYL